MQPIAAPDRPETLTAEGLLPSDLWLDRPDALAAIARRRAAGELSDAEAANLVQFVEQGWLSFRPVYPDALLDDLVADVDRLWQVQPPDAAFAYHSLLTRFSGRDGDKRRPSCRIGDLHGWSAVALELYLQPEIHRYMELILGETPVATQSLYFEWGSQQALHRDPIHVRMKPAAHLAAAWIALEDIGPESGPLVYVPGSHKLPYFEFAPGRYYFDHTRDDAEAIRRAEAWDAERCRERGLAATPFLPKKGEVLIWHHSLLHGGSLPADPPPTRKSFVVHFTSLSSMPEVTNSFLDPYAAGAADGRPLEMVYRTRRVLSRCGCRGFASPLAERFREEVAGFYAGTDAVRRRVLELEATVAQREAVIAGMRQSRFWKMRDAWFALKRALGARA